MATCAHCGVSTREEPGAIVVQKILQAKPLGSYSLAGQQTKISAVETLRMVCRCGWSVCGRIDGDSFIADLNSQVFPGDEDE